MRHVVRSGRASFACALLALLAVATGTAAQEPQANAPQRPRIGLVLSGGGARGAAHVGVLKVLEELRIPVDRIVGNSMGALVAGIYASGYSPQEMEDILAGVAWPLLLTDRSRRQDRSFRRKQDDVLFQIDATVGVRDLGFVLPKGLSSGHAVGNLLRSLVLQRQPVVDFDELRIPYRAVATDIVGGGQVVLSSGDLAQAMAASMAIPGVFSPVVIDGRQLVDGMVVNNLPIDVCKAIGADVVIAVDIGTPLLEAEQIRSLLEVTGQMLGVLMQKNIDEQVAKLTDADTLIRPDLGGITAASFDRVQEAIAIGERTARAHAERLRRYSVSEEEYRDFHDRQRQARVPPPIVDRIELHNESPLDDEVILTLVETKAGDTFDPKQLQRDFDRVYGLEEFEKVTFELRETTPGHANLLLRAVGKSWGPNYLNFGLNLEDDFEGDASYSLGVRYTMRALNGLGAELRNELLIGEPIRAFSEFYQPLDAQARWFVAPQVGVQQEEISAFSGGTKLGEFDTRVGWVGFDLGSHLGNWAELRAGVRRSWGDVDPDVAAVPVQGFSFDDGYVHVTADVDTFDSTHFPTDGWKATAEWSQAFEALGADTEYQRVEAKVGRAFSFGANTVMLIADVGSAVDGTIPVYRLVRRGGFLNLSGFTKNELTGQAGGVVRALGYRRIGGTPFATFGMATYLGASIEAGKVTDDRSELFHDPLFAGSVFLGVDSPLGPIYVAYGLAEGGQDSAYFFIGQTF